MNRHHFRANQEGDDEGEAVADEGVPVPTDAVIDDSPPVLMKRI